MNWLKANVFMVACIALGIALTGAGIKVWELSGDLADARATINAKDEHIAALMADVQTARNNIAVVEVGLSTCNKSIDELQTAGVARTVEVLKQIDSAKTLNKFLAERVLYLQSAQRPAGMSACDNAKRLIDEEITAGR